MTGLLRMAAVVGVVSWYFTIRWIVWNYGMGPREHGEPVFVFLSYFVSLPLTLLSCAIVVGMWFALNWVVEGFVQ